MTLNLPAWDIQSKCSKAQTAANNQEYVYWNQTGLDLILHESCRCYFSYSSRCDCNPVTSVKYLLRLSQIKLEDKILLKHDKPPATCSMVVMMTSGASSLLFSGSIFDGESWKRVVYIRKPLQSITPFTLTLLASFLWRDTPAKAKSWLY